VRIGTWNLEAKWSDGHREVIAALDCDVLLLTEVSARTRIPDHDQHWGESLCSPGAHWAAVMAKTPLSPLVDPHPASAAALSSGVSFCSSVLPWPLSGRLPAFPGARHQERFEAAVTTILESLDGPALVWGGDWNQPLTGALSGFSRGGRQTLLDAAVRAELQLPLAAQQGRITGQGAIDQIAVPLAWRVDGSGRIPVAPALSDHDAYWVEVGTP